MCEERLPNKYLLHVVFDDQASPQRHPIGRARMTPEQERQLTKLERNLAHDINLRVHRQLSENSLIEVNLSYHVSDGLIA